MPKIILASSSITRKTLLSQLQLKYTAISPDVDESPLPDELPAELALRLAKTKALAVASQFPDAIIIGADQVVMCGDNRLDKPGTIENAIKQLECVSGKSIDSYTGLCLYNSRTQRIQTDVETFQVSFRELSHTMIEDYVKRDTPLHCAGSIKAEGIGITLFTRMNGRDHTALLGLPLILLTDMLIHENIHVLGG